MAIMCCYCILRNNSECALLSEILTDFLKITILIFTDYSFFYSKKKMLKKQVTLFPQDSAKIIAEPD